MKKLALLTALLTIGLILFGCGGKADTVEAEKATTPTTANPAAANVNTTAAGPDRDADDRVAANTTAPSTANTNYGSTFKTGRDRDDVRPGKTNANSNSTNVRRDADDRGKHDNDRDTDRDADDQ